MSTPIEWEEIGWGHHRAFRSSSDRVTLVVVPDVGGKVVSLVDLASGREWLTRVDPAALTAPTAGRPWVDYDRSGWDECFPNIGSGIHPGPGPVGLELEEQGELWRWPWRVTITPDELVMSFDGRVFPYTFTRRLTVHGPRIDVGYEVLNRGSVPFAYMWAMHPLVAVRPGWRISGPTGRSRVDSAVGLGIRADDHITWPLAPGPGGDPLDLSVTYAADRGVATKLFGVSTGEPIVIDAPDGSLSFTPGPRIGDLGIWLNYGGWPTEDPLHHIAIEPSVGHHDDLARSVAAGRARIVDPGASATWSVAIEVGR